MADVLVDFLNHGALPFVGRRAEQEHILRFWSERGDKRFALEALLLTGEAGVGKSRLIEETIPVIESRRGAVVHIRLRPEGSTSLAPLIVSGIERSDSARGLFRTLPADTFGAAVAGLRRLCALRRTLLVIEDIHLLEGASLQEFSLLLEGLRDESFGLLAARRPVESPAVDILEAYITGEIRLEGLETEEIEEMWGRLFSDRASGAMAEMLKRTTHGNALALRAALRGGVRVGTGKRAESGQSLEVRIEPWAFRESARRAARAVVTGMTAGLESGLLESACRLALLGEVFSHRCGAEMTDNAEQVIAALIFKGILTHTATSSTPINTGERHGSPVSFTHSLVHNDLLADAPDAVRGLVRSLGSGGPVYTYLPYRMIASRAGSADVPADELAAAVRACCNTSRLVNMSADWRNADLPLNAARRMMEWLPEDFDERERDRLAAPLLWAELDLRVRRRFDSEHRELAERLLHIAAADPSMVDYRLIALEHLIRNATDMGQGDGKEIFDEAVDFAAGNAAARVSPRYMHLLYVAATAAHNRDDRGMLERIETIVEEILQEEELSEEDRHNIMLRLLPSFLTQIYSAEDLKKRTDRLEQLLPVVPPLGPDTTQAELAPYFHLQSFYLALGEIDRLVELGRSFTPLLQQHGLQQSYYLTRRWQLLGECLRGEKDIRDLAPWNALAQELERDGALSGPEKERLRISIARNRHNAAYLLGDLPLMEQVLEEWDATLPAMPAANRMIHSLWQRDYAGFADTANELPDEVRPLARIAWERLESEEEERRAIEGNIDHLRNHPYDLFQFVRTYIAIEILERAMEHGVVPPDKEPRERIEKEAHDALAHCLTLLAERRLPLLMEPILRLYGKYFSRSERRAWQERTEAIAGERRRTLAPIRSERIAITMFDTITVEIPGRERERLRGGRSAALLGLLVASRMLKYPPDRPDFFALASGVENDPDRARTATNVAVLRLREAIGREAILTGNDLPELNEELVRTDLLTAWRELERGERELHGGHLLNGREAAVRAATIAAGRVPFPGLYDELFERLREDMETRLRNLVLGVAERLVCADDPKEAEALLRLWNERVPGDEAALRLLAETLERSGERAEAVTIRARGMGV